MINVPLGNKREPFHHMVLCRMGAHLGNGNDHWFGKGQPHDNRRVWKVLDRVAHEMYVYGERRALRERHQKGGASS